MTIKLHCACYPHGFPPPNSSFPSHIPPPPQTHNGTLPWNRVIAEFFGECVYNELQMVAFICGMLSIGFWIVCQAPQFYRNYKSRSVAALSGWFLAEWALGDSLNLVSAFLTNQLSTQKFTAMLFVFMDTCLLSQFLYYSYIFNHDEVDSDDEDQPRRRPKPQRKPPSEYEKLLGDKKREQINFYGDMAVTLEGVNANNPNGLHHKTVNASTFHHDFHQLVEDGKENHNNINEETQPNTKRNVGLGILAGMFSLSMVFYQTQETVSKRNLQMRLPFLPPCNALHLPDNIRYIGDVFAWISCTVYFSSRLPQIYKNYQRKSVEGLSFFMFFSAIMGNLLYALGILLRVTAWKDIENSLPFLIGSLGTISLDLTILVQFILYSIRDKSVTAGLRRKRILKDHPFLSESKIPRGLYDIVAPGSSPLWGSPSEFTAETPIGEPFKNTFSAEIKETSSV